MSFVVVNPLLARPDYSFDVTLDDLKNVSSKSTDSMDVYVIGRLDHEIGVVTLNLQGPIVINSKEKIGHQFVLADTNYTTKEKFKIKMFKSA